MISKQSNNIKNVSEHKDIVTEYPNLKTCQEQESASDFPDDWSDSFLTVSRW